MVSTECTTVEPLDSMLRPTFRQTLQDTTGIRYVDRRLRNREFVLRLDAGVFAGFGFCVIHCGISLLHRLCSCFSRSVRKDISRPGILHKTFSYVRYCSTGEAALNSTDVPRNCNEPILLTNFVIVMSNSKCLKRIGAPQFLPTTKRNTEKRTY